MNNIRNDRQKLVNVGLLLILFISIFGSFKLYQISKFHIVNIDPSLSSITTNYPYLQVFFNDALQPESLKLDDPQNIIGTTKVENKSITLEFNNLLVNKKSYSIYIKEIRNIKGDLISNKKLSFTAKDKDFKDMSKKQQKILIDSQDKPLYEVSQIQYDGFNSLLDYGLSADQLDIIKNNLYDYSLSVHRQFWKIKLDKSSVVAVTHNSNSADTTDKLRFNVTLNNTLFNLQTSYQLLYDDVDTTITDVTGATVYDSKQ